MTIANNWARNQSFASFTIHEPASVEELRRILSKSPKIHLIGAGHSFNDIAVAPEMVDLALLPQVIEIDREAMSVTVTPRIRYGDLAVELETAGLALHNMASLPHISVGGAVITATHGSGDANGNLSTAVSAVELITSDGEIVQYHRGDADFPGVVVNIGALGAVTKLTLDVQPTYQVRQEIFLGLPWRSVEEQFYTVMSCADSVSLFLTYADPIEQLWCKSRVQSGDDWSPASQRLGALAADQKIHPVSGLAPDNVTDQSGVPGPWHLRLPHFRMEGAPASGDELQTEFMVARGVAVEALLAVRAIGPKLQPHLWVSEIRSVAPDDLWLSTAYGRETICIHFSWKNDLAAVQRLLPELEATLAPFAPRPHWGKIFITPADDVRSRYPRAADFIALQQRLDPRGAFINDYLERCLFG